MPLHLYTLPMVSYEILNLRNGISLKIAYGPASASWGRKKVFLSLMERYGLARAEIKAHPSTPEFYLKHHISCCRRLLDIFWVITQMTHAPFSVMGYMEKGPDPDNGVSDEPEVFAFPYLGCSFARHPQMSVFLWSVRLTLGCIFLFKEANTKIFFLAE